MEFSKTKARELLNRDYIPRGPQVDIREMKLQFRRTKEHEVYRCTCQTNGDPQSGPIFCGELAEYVAFFDKKVVALCGERGHVPPNPEKENPRDRYLTYVYSAFI